MSSPRLAGPQGLALPHASRNRFRPATRPDAETWALRALTILLSACLILQPTAEAHVRATRRGRSFLADLAAPVSSSFAKIAATVFSGPPKSPHRMAFRAESLESDSFPADVFVRRFREGFVGKYS